MKGHCYGSAIFLAAVLLVSTAIAQVPPPLTPRPNVLVIVLDDLGKEKLGLYDQDPPMVTPPTPNLTAIADSGVRFTWAYANPKCSPSRAAIMTSRHPFRTGMGENTYLLEDDEVTIAEMLKGGFPGQTPYHCGAFGKWHLAPSYPTFDPNDPNYHNDPRWHYTHAIDQGFDKFVGTMDNFDQVPEDEDHYYWKMVTADPNSFSISFVGGANGSGPFDETTYSASVTRKAAQFWINNEVPQSEPFVAYVCFNAPHVPLQVPPLSTLSPETAAMVTMSNYAAGADARDGELPLVYNWMIESVDTEIGRLLSGIAPNKLVNTTILIVGDNGTPGTLLPYPTYDPAHGKGTVYELGTRVPLIVAGRGVPPSTISCEGLVSAVDIWPTIAALTGVQLLPTVVRDGISFWHMVLNPGAASARTQAFVQLYSKPGPYEPDPNAFPPAFIEVQDRAMNDGHYKYIRKYTRGVLPPVTEEAYDLENDALETNDLWLDFPAQPLSVRMKLIALKNAMINLSGL